MFSKIDETKSLRGEYGKTLTELGATNDKIVVLDADLSSSTQTIQFKKAYPERFFNVGISEQDLIGTACGLALEGKTVFVSSFAVFATGRCFDQIRNSLCYQNLNVKIVGTHGGLTVGEDGATHQALEDISIMRSIPNMNVIVPSDAVEVKLAIKYALEHDGPFYIRIPRTNLKTIFDESEYTISPKKIVKIKEGSDVTLITNGETLGEVIKASKMLENDNIKAEILNMPFVKPICDYDTLIESSAKTKQVITIENHSIIGGVGSAVCEILSEFNPVKINRIGVNDTFSQSGSAKELMEHYGLSADKLYKKIKEILDK